MPMVQGRSAQLRRTFEELPAGYGRDFVRGRADTLLRQGGSMEDAMEQALTEAARLFPEVMLIVRCKQDRPFERSDVFMIEETAMAAMELRQESIDWRAALASGEIVKGRGKGVTPEPSSDEEEAAPSGKGSGKGFTAFSGSGHRMSD